jgi:hypothetical protein
MLLISQSFSRILMDGQKAYSSCDLLESQS